MVGAYAVPWNAAPTRRRNKMSLSGRQTGRMGPEQAQSAPSGQDNGHGQKTRQLRATCRRHLRWQRSNPPSFSETSSGTLKMEYDLFDSLSRTYSSALSTMVYELRDHCAWSLLTVYVRVRVVAKR